MSKDGSLFKIKPSFLIGPHPELHKFLFMHKMKVDIFLHHLPERTAGAFAVGVGGENACFGMDQFSNHLEAFIHLLRRSSIGVAKAAAFDENGVPGKETIGEEVTGSTGGVTWRNQTCNRSRAEIDDLQMLQGMQIGTLVAVIINFNGGHINLGIVTFKQRVDQIGMIVMGMRQKKRG